MTSATALLLASAASLMLLPASSQAAPHDIDHVLLVSVDGLHARDLARYTAAHAGSALAGLAARAAVFPNAFTTAPSDSFPA